MEQDDFSFDDLFDDGYKTIPAPAGAYLHVCAFCGHAKEECRIRKNDPLPIEMAVQNYVAAHTHVREM